MTNRIFKDGLQIQNLEAWQLRAGPKRAMQWKDGRSAKESAKSWLASDGIPAELLVLLKNHSDFDHIGQWLAEPEAPVRIDTFKDEPPNIDVLVRANDRLGPIAIVVEAKADESFGKTVGDTFKDAKQRLSTTPNSKDFERLERLSSALFGRTAKDEALNEIRYQLLTACSAALTEAERMQADRAVVLVHEFVSSQTEASKRQANYADFVKFISMLDPSIEITQDLMGPIMVPGSPLVNKAAKVYLGKATSDVRGAGV